MARLVAVAFALAAGLGAATGAGADEADAKRLLKAMSDYMASQKTVSAVFDTSIEVVTPDLQKIQFDSSGELLLTRPDKLRARRTGGYADVAFVFDGKAFTVHDRHRNIFAQSDATSTVDQLVERLRNEYAVEAPGADLLVSQVHDQLMAGVLDAKHIGLGVVNGVECEHLAFRNHDTDWQIWIEAGPKPMPRKYVITSKAVAGAPQYTLTVREWRTDAAADAQAFAFKAPAGAKQVGFEELAEIDEVPPGVVKGAKQ